MINSNFVMLFWFPRKKKIFVNPATSLNIIYIYVKIMHPIFWLIFLLLMSKINFHVIFLLCSFELGLDPVENISGSEDRVYK